MDPDSRPNDYQGPFVPAQVVTHPPVSSPRKRSSVLRSLLLAFLVVCLGGSLLMNIALVGMLAADALDSEGRVREKHFSHQQGAKYKIAIISVEGAILDGQGFVKRQIDRAAKDDDVKAIVLRVNSPGGTITGSDYIYHHLRELAKESEIPIVVSMGGIAASGGYYVSMAVGDTPDTIFAEPTTWTGSIGVIIPHYDLSELLGSWGIKEDSIASHRLKSMGSFAKPMTEEEQKIFKELVDESFTRFKDLIKSGRPKFRKSPEALDKLATGQIYTAEQAKQSGLVDKIGFLEDAVDRAIELAGVTKDDVEVVKYKREPNLADVLLGVQARDRNLDLATLLDLSTPRAYYLCTRLPPLACSRR